MNGWRQHFALTLRLHFRNRMALLYGYLFPVVFLAAFWVLYRHEPIPLVRHLGELLTVTVLGGACFGLPTTLVSERERGVWRRYRIAPLSLGGLLASTVAARYVLLLTAGLLQLALALAAGMPWPAHPLALLAAFSVVAFAFIGLGLVIAAFANNVPAVQALGQCIFLPMLIIGGVAVPLRALPDWAQHLSAFFPGRYAVEALQSCATGAGFADAAFAWLALAIIGAAGVVAGAMLFRWDAQQPIDARSGAAWLALALAAWVGVGALAETRGRVEIVREPAAASAEIPAPPSVSMPAPPPDAAPTSADASSLSENPQAWFQVTPAVIAILCRADVPPDDGVVAPMAADDSEPDPHEWPEDLAEQLRTWEPASTTNPVQRVRNLLLVAAAPDVLQMGIERFAPLIVLDELRRTAPAEELAQLLAWIALHPESGDMTALDRLPELDIPPPPDVEQARERVYFYAIKFLRRLTQQPAATKAG